MPQQWYHLMKFFARVFQVRKNVPCYVPEISCGRQCGKRLACGHKCIKKCHKVDHSLFFLCVSGYFKELHICWKSNNTNARLMAFAPSLALDPTFGIHSHKTLNTAQPFHLLKPSWKSSSSHSIFAPTNISTHFLLQSLCVCVVRVCVFLYNTLCKLFW